jgi:cysteine-rich repeat protein
VKRIVLLVLGALGVASGCISSDTVECEDHTLCPASARCTVVMIGDTPKTHCATPDLQCSDEGAQCDLPGDPGRGTCHSGICLRTVCGNFLQDFGEACDDGNLVGTDGCSSDCLSNETCGNGITDLLANEECDSGPDKRGHDGCSGDCVLETARWRSLATERPIPRRGIDLVYEPKRGCTLVFGGEEVSPSVPRNYQDTFEWDGYRWRAGDPSTPPTRRAYAAIAYDDVRDEVVLFSGSTRNADLWSWNGSAWTVLAPPTRPDARQGSHMVTDTTRHRIVLFGGLSWETFNYPQTTWLWNGVTWELATTATSPPGRGGHAMAFDPHRGVVVLFGGGTTLTPNNELWEFDGTDWTQRTVAGGPSPRFNAAMAFDPITQRIMVAGGNLSLTATTNDAFEWDGTTWTPVAALPFTDAAGNTRNGMSTDPVRGRVEFLATNGVLYEFDGTSWLAPPDGTTLTVEPLPAAREAHSAVLDSTRREIVLYGGSTNHQSMNSPGPLGDTWIWNSAWRQQAIGSSPTPARWGAQMVYDPKHDTVVLFGGCTVTGSNGACAAPLADTWLWKNRAWSQATPSTSPPPRSHAAIVWDAAREQVVMLGGLAAGTDALDDMWAWDGTTWSPITPATLPPRRYQAAIGYDAVRERVVLFGGTTNRKTYNDTWLWDGTSWTEATLSTSPTSRTDARLAYDGARSRLVLFGGRVGLSDSARAESVDDVWEWTGTAWELLATTNGGSLAAGRFAHTLVPAVDGAGVVSFAGSTATLSGVGASLNDLWRLQWDSRAQYETCRSGDTDRDALFGCADPDCWWACSPQCPPETSCTAAPTCGDGSCAAGVEDCGICPTDCGTCTPRCGDFACNGPETQASCPGDCP